MRMKKITFILSVIMILSIFASIPMSAFASETELFYDDFEDYSVDTYPLSFTQQYSGTGPGNQKIILTSDYDGAYTKVFQLEGANNWASEQYVNLPIELPNDLILEAYIMPVSGSTPGEISLRNLDVGWGERIATVWFGQNGKIQAIENGDYSNPIDAGYYTLGQWYNIRLEINIPTKTYDVYIDGTMVKENIQTHQTVAPKTLSLVAGNLYTNKIYFDNVGLYTKVDEPYSGGTGAAEDPYLISTPADLFELAQKATSMDVFNNKYFKQIDNINLIANDNLWIPYFDGNYDGNGYHIDNMSINGTGSHNVGMIGFTGSNALLQGITLKNIDVRGNYEVGALVSNNEGQIKGCNIDGSVTGIGKVGGLAGFSKGWIEDCHVNVSVTGSQSMTGGLVGYAVWCNIDQCSATGSIGGVQQTGGLIGYLQGGNLSNSYAKAYVTASLPDSQDIGGLVGRVDAGNDFTTNISNCYSHSNIQAPDDKYVGGMFGANYWGTASNCYAAGSIDASGSNVGGLTGMIYSGTITSNSYYDAELSGLSDAGKGTPKSTDEMKQISTYNNWSFPAVWTINTSDNNGYPALEWQGFIHEPLSDDARLSGLSASGMTITPAFEASVTSYLANVTNDISNTTITANPASESATVKINGIRGNSKEVSLNVGSNLITVEVTAEDGVTSKIYTINITRERYVPVENQKPVLTSDWNYTTVYFGQHYPFTIAVTDYENTPNTRLYSYIDDNAPNQSYNFAEVPGTVNITLSPLKGVLSAGNHTLNYYAVDAGGAVSSVLVLPFTIVEENTSESSLSSISLTGIDLRPAFNSETLNYTASVNNSVITTTVTAIAASETARVKINSTIGSSKTVSLNVGSNLITVVVTAEDGITSKTYTIEITREDTGSTESGGSSSYKYYTISAKAEKGGQISPWGSISVRKGRDKDFAITANKGYLISDLLVDGKSIGSVDNYTFKDVSKSHTITAKFAEEVQEELIEPESSDNKIPFADVSKNHWFVNDVMWAYEKGLMNGTSSTIFDPDGITTRGMIVTILYRLEGSPQAEANIFIDVEAEKYYTNAVAWAAKNKVVKGYGNGKFGPEDPITREQLATILVNYAEYKSYDASSRADLSKFEDFGEVSYWAEDAMSWASFEKLIQGDSNRLMPTGNAKRTQVAAILHRFVENIINSSN